MLSSFFLLSLEHWKSRFKQDWTHDQLSHQNVRFSRINRFHAESTVVRMIILLLSTKPWHPKNIEDGPCCCYWRPPDDGRATRPSWTASAGWRRPMTPETTCSFLGSRDRAAIMRRCCHPNIVELQTSFAVGSQLWMVLESFHTNNVFGLEPNNCMLVLFDKTSPRLFFPRFLVH